MNLNSILIGSDSPERLVAYYQRLLGAPAMAEGPYTTFRIGSGAVTVGPHNEVRGPNSAPGRLIWNMESADVPGDFARLEAAGATVVRRPYQFTGLRDAWIATFADPDGNLFQLISPYEPASG